MAKGDIQYFADTLLLEKLFMIEQGLTKQAGLVDVFRGVADAIKQQVAERVQQEGISGALVTYLAPAVLGRIWAPLGIITTLASMWGISVGSIMNSVLNTLRPKLESGVQVTLEEVNNAGKSAAQSVIGENLSAEAGDDLFFYLRKIEAEGKLTRLVKNAQWGSVTNKLTQTYKASPWLAGSGGILGRIFGSVGRLRGKWMLVGIIIWFIKTVLIGAGLVEGAKAVSKVIGIGEESKEEKPGAGFTGREVSTEQSQEQPVEEPHPVTINIPTSISHNFKPSGQGIQYHINDGTSIWIVPLLNSDIVQTLISWAISIYPETKGYENDMQSLPSLINLASLLSKGVDPNSPNYMTVPKGFTSRKQVVDKFIGNLKVDNKEKNES